MSNICSGFRQYKAPVRVIYTQAADYTCFLQCKPTAFTDVTLAIRNCEDNRFQELLLNTKVCLQNSIENTFKMVLWEDDSPTEWSLSGPSQQTWHPPVALHPHLPHHLTRIPHHLPLNSTHFCCHPVNPSRPTSSWVTPQTLSHMHDNPELI